jgi:hypothetical protein
MRCRGGRPFRYAVLGTLVLAGFLSQGRSWAKGPRRQVPGLWIVADRIVGFVPFTVYVYGKVRGEEPGRIELCRSEVAWLTDSSASRTVGGRGASLDANRDSGPEEPACSSSGTVRTPDGYDYTHDMHFDHPGIFHVRLMMVDPAGHRVVSNTVQVNAF